MKHEKQTAFAPARELTDKRLREFLRARKFNFLLDLPARPIVQVRQSNQVRGRK